MTLVLIADGKRIFLSVRLFIYLKLSSRIGTLLTCTALHAVRGDSRQMGRKGNRLPFATASQVICARSAN